MTLFESDETPPTFPEWVRKVAASDSEIVRDTAAADLAAWLAATVPALWDRLPLALAATQTERDKAGNAIPRYADLMVVLQWWNKLAAAGLVSHTVRENPPSAEIVKAWKAWCKNPGWQAEWVDLSALELHIRKSSRMVLSGWFRLEKLLRNGANKDGCPIIQKLRDGGYYDETTKPGTEQPNGWDVLQEFAEGGRVPA